MRMNRASDATQEVFRTPSAFISALMAFTTFFASAGEIVWDMTSSQPATSARWLPLRPCWVVAVEQSQPCPTSCWDGIWFPAPATLSCSPGR